MQSLYSDRHWEELPNESMLSTGAQDLSGTFTVSAYVGSFKGENTKFKTAAAMGSQAT